MNRSIAIVLAAFAVRLSAAPHPNIVYILADDLGYGDVHALAPDLNRIPTPHMDKLAAESMVFTDAHSGSAVCTPTRYGILTGRYAWRTHLQSSVLWGLSAPLIAPGRATVGKLLQAQGYHTAAIGKWHLGLEWAGGPSEAVDIEDVKIDYTQPVANGPVTRGFDYFFGISASLDMAPYVYIENDRVVQPATRHQTEWFRSGLAAKDFHAVDVLGDLTRRTVAYIERSQSGARPDAKPFFLYFALTSPHTPIMPTPGWKGRSKVGEYGDFVMETDSCVGEIMAALERSGLATNTILIVTSDNGCSAAPAKAIELGKIGHHPSGPYRGYKSDLWEGGHRIPFIVRWPGKVRAGSRSDRPLCLTDLFATCAEITGATIPASAAEDSVSFLPTLLGEKQLPRAPVIHHSISGHFAIREGPWKLLLARGSGGWTSPTELEATERGLPAVQLYRVGDDPGEEHNLASAHPEVVARLAAQLAQQVATGRSTPGPVAKNDVMVDLWKSGQTPNIPAPALPPEKSTQ